MPRQSPITMTVGKLILLVVFLLAGPSGCSLLMDPKVFVLPEYANDPSRYYVLWYQVKDERVEYNDHALCELDRLSKHQLEAIVTGAWTLIHRGESDASAVTTPVRETVESETVQWISQNSRSSRTPTTLKITITCVGLSGNKLEVDVHGRLFAADKLLWEAHGTALDFLDLTFGLPDIDWDSKVNNLAKSAVLTCLAKLPSSTRER